MKSYEVFTDETEAVKSFRKFEDSQFLVLFTYSEGVDPIYTIKKKENAYHLEPIDVRFDNFQLSAISPDVLISEFKREFCEYDNDIEFALVYGTRGLTQYLVNKDCHSYFLDEMFPTMTREDALTTILDCAKILGLEMKMTLDSGDNGIVEKYPINGNKILVENRDFYKSDIAKHIDFVTLEKIEKVQK